MDPNETLIKLRALCAAVLDGDDETDPTETAEEMAELFQALDQWIARGGFLPASWKKATPSP